MLYKGVVKQSSMTFLPGDKRRAQFAVYLQWCRLRQLLTFRPNSMGLYEGRCIKDVNRDTILPGIGAPTEDPPPSTEEVQSPNRRALRA